MPKTESIQLGEALEIPILYEDRAVLAIDKPAGWMLAPSSWENTRRNLTLAIESSIKAREFWARSRNLKFLRFVHRLDGDTTGVVLFSKSPGAIPNYSRIFQSRAVTKLYLVVVIGAPAKSDWNCDQPIGEDKSRPGLMRLDSRRGRESLTRFRLLQTYNGRSLVLAEPVTGRTHQIRLHLTASDLPILGDPLYSKVPVPTRQPAFPLALRSIYLGYTDPFSRKPIAILAPWIPFAEAFGFDAKAVPNFLQGHKSRSRHLP